MSTMPIVLAGAMTVSMNLTGPVETAAATPKRPAVPKSELSPTARAAARPPRPPGRRRPPAAARVRPRHVHVVRGDTVSAIAARYGLSTAAVLAANGLGPRSLIFPGQVLKLSGAVRARRVRAPARYTIVRGDTISGIAQRYGLTTQACSPPTASAGRASSTRARPSRSPDRRSRSPRSRTSRRPTRRRRRRRARRRRSINNTYTIAPRRHGHLDRRALRREHRRGPERQRPDPREHHLRGPHADDPRRDERPGRIDASPR